MSVVRAQIGRAYHTVLAARIRGVIDAEALKGCSPELSDTAVALEPGYKPLSELLDQAGNNTLSQAWHGEEVPNMESLVRYRIWVPDDHEMDWTAGERFLKCLQKLTSRAGSGP